MRLKIEKGGLVPLTLLAHDQRVVPGVRLASPNGKKGPMQKAATYIRVSTGQQAEEGHSLQTQKDACAKYADEKNFQQETNGSDSEKEISSISPPPDAKGPAPAKDFFRGGSKGKPKVSRTLMVAASDEWRKLKLEKVGRYGTQDEIDVFESEYGTWDTFLERFLAEVS